MKTVIAVVLPEISSLKTRKQNILNYKIIGCHYKRQPLYDK